LTIKEQETHLNLHEYDDDDDGSDNVRVTFGSIYMGHF